MALEYYDERTKFSVERALTHIPPEYGVNPRYFDIWRGKFNIGKTGSGNGETEMLSNFAACPFLLDGVVYASVEGFIQMLKEPDGERQQEVAAMVGYEAKRAGKTCSAEIGGGYHDPGQYGLVGYVTNYQGLQIPYRSPDHYRLIERAIRAKFEQNPGAMKILVGERYSDRREIAHKIYKTRGSEVVEIVERDTTSLPEEVFMCILMRLRHEKQIEYWGAEAGRRDVSDEMSRYFGITELSTNIDLMRIVKRGYETALVKWLRSLTPGGMRLGKLTEQERLGKVAEYARLAGVKDVVKFAREWGLA